ncbi:MAG: cellulase family glycosylhydrolase [Phycisphaerae bacterium]|nr:cellulase family glycosylhydrolase [Phycisphaerae bacterium]
MLSRYQKILSGCIVSLFACALCSAQTFDNAAPDTKECPYITKMIASTRDGWLVLRFDGDLRLGRRTNVVKRNMVGIETSTFPIAVNQLVVTLNNEALDNCSLTVGPDQNNTLKIFPEISGVQVKVLDGGVELTIPFKSVQYSPLDILADVNSIYYINKDMVATTGRNLFSATEGKPVRVKIDSLPEKPDAPEAAELKAVKVSPALATLAWRTNNRATAEVTLRAKGQAEITAQQNLYSHKHRIVIPNLQPDTEYIARATGEDFAGRKTKPASLTFRTPPLPPMDKRDAWLAVEGKFIVDSAGRPFVLGGYSTYMGEYWWDEFPRYGTQALMARYFRTRGFNVCRLGLVEHEPSHWSDSIMRDGSAFEKFGGPAGYVKKFVRPLVDQIVGEGMYVIIDWHDSYKLDAKKIRAIGDFWEACAMEFKDDPGVAMYQLLNEPCFVDGQNRPDLAGRLREITKNYIERIRKHDKRHILLVSDWNCGWGWATEDQWSPVNFDPGDPQGQIVYSKHISKEHTNDAFMIGGMDNVADKWNVPMFFDEVEMGVLLPPRNMGWFFDFLSRNERKYGFAIWVAGQYPEEQLEQFSAFAQTYLSVSPLPVRGEKPIVNWWRVTNPAVRTVNVKRKDGGETQKWVYRYKLPKEFPAGDFGLLAEGAAPGTTVEIAIAPADDPEKLMGTWLGATEGVTWRRMTIKAGVSAVNDAVYFHALKSFVEVVIRSESELIRPCCKDDGKDRTELQLFQLNPKHRMPVPNKLQSGKKLFVDLTAP